VPEDAFARKVRKLPPRDRAAPSVPEDERTTVVCACGVVMTLSWKTAQPVCCFGCDRVFAPPPTATAAPLRWRPDLAHKKPSRARSIAIASLIAFVLILLMTLALRVLFAHP